MKRGLFSIVLVACLCVPAALFGGLEGGVSASCITSACYVSASVSPITLLVSPLILSLYLFGRSPVAPGEINGVVGVFLRFGAILIDMFSVMLVVLPITILPVLATEAVWTGEFRWEFARDFARSTDFIVVLFLLTSMASVLLYFVFVPKAGQPTMGQFICGYQIVPAHSEEKMHLVRRTIFAWIAVVIWPITLMYAMNRDSKVYWWDRASSSRAVRTYYS